MSFMLAVLRSLLLVVSGRFYFEVLCEFQPAHNMWRHSSSHAWQLPTEMVSCGSRESWDKCRLGSTVGGCTSAALFSEADRRCLVLLRPREQVASQPGATVGAGRVRLLMEDGRTSMWDRDSVSQIQSTNRGVELWEFSGAGREQMGAPLTWLRCLNIHSEAEPRVKSQPLLSRTTSDTMEVRVFGDQSGEGHRPHQRGALCVSISGSLSFT